MKLTFLDYHKMKVNYFTNKKKLYFAHQLTNYYTL